MILDKIGSWNLAEHDKRSAEEALAEVEREIGIRQRCFDRWVSEGKLSIVDARDRMERLLAAARYIRLYEEERQKVEYLNEGSEDVKSKVKGAA